MWIIDLSIYNSVSNALELDDLIAEKGIPCSEGIEEHVLLTH